MTASWRAGPPGGAFTDLYELTMAQAYYRDGLTAPAVFELFFRDIHPERNFLLIAGLADALTFLENVAFAPEDLDYLSRQPQFDRDFVERLASLRFSGDVYAMPEGTVAFPGEPVLQVVASLPEAQIVETALLNRLSSQTLLASKAARVVLAARGRPVIDFGLRRAMGTDAGMQLARCSYLAGAAGTSNVLAGRQWGIPISGTMAHSYIQAHGSELEAFCRFVRHYPQTVLLVDTYDTLAGIDNVIALAEEMDGEFKVKAVRLDSGNLGALARQVRRKLDDAGLRAVDIFASGGLDEYAIDRLLGEGAPIGGFGVGTRMAVSEDAPALDAAYKLVDYNGEGRLKTSENKATLAGRKQVFRRMKDDVFGGDVVGLFDEAESGEPLLAPAMRQGRILDTARETLDAIRRRAHGQIERLSDRFKTVDYAQPVYPVTPSPGVEALSRRIIEALKDGRRGGVAAR